LVPGPVVENCKTHRAPGRMDIGFELEQKN